jgi:WD40 repeat protein
MSDDQGDRRASSPEIIRLPEGVIRPPEIVRLPESDVVEAPEVAPAPDVVQVPEVAPAPDVASPAQPTMPPAPPAPEVVRPPEAAIIPEAGPTEASVTWLPPVVITDLNPLPRRRLGARRVILIVLAVIIVAGAAVAVVRLLTGNGSDASPAWSPDGSHIAFVYQGGAATG